MNNQWLIQDAVRQILLAPVYDVAIQTRLDRLPNLSERFERNIWLKREDLQPIRSFKLRGAYNKIHSLTQEQKDAGVVTASAGNHAQGVALAARSKKIRAVIVMPQTTPEIKVAAVKSLGGEVILQGTSFDTAQAYAKQLAEERGLTLISPFDDMAVIAGQGTIGQELLQQQRNLEAVFIPVGGGGLIAGVASYIKTLAPQIKIYAVEPENSACLKAAFAANMPISLAKVSQFADGVAVKKMGDTCYELARHCVDEVITVSSDEICAAIQDIYEEQRAIAEPSGALALAGLKKYCLQGGSATQLAAILSGGNINFHSLRYVSERCELGEGKEAVLAVTIPEKRGAFLAFCQALKRRAITEFNYRLSDRNTANIFVGVKLKHAQELAEIRQALFDAGYQHQDLSQDETAKLHVRYMVGGLPPFALQERLFQVSFAEAPGALEQFLTELGQNWNISLFHYRNHGAAEGRVLLGIEVADEDFAQLKQQLHALDNHCEEVTESPAYQFFLKANTRIPT